MAAGREGFEARAAQKKSVLDGLRDKIEAHAQPPEYKKLRTNKYTFKRPSLKLLREEVPQCMCQSQPTPAAGGAEGEGEGAAAMPCGANDCLNRGPSFAYSLPVHSFHTRRDRVASLTTCRLHGAAIQRASPLGPGRALTLPCG